MCRCEPAALSVPLALLPRRLSLRGEAAESGTASRPISRLLSTPVCALSAPHSPFHEPVLTFVCASVLPSLSPSPPFSSSSNSPLSFSLPIYADPVLITVTTLQQLLAPSRSQPPLSIPRSSRHQPLNEVR